ncbi:MAG: hypothetical protein GX230_10075 [Lentisphaerae bacterium]|jgi:hypothetical protein|nr:hypothetical protein [Lentisphaerota bacterium]
MNERESVRSGAVREADWKKFCNMLTGLRTRYIAACNERLIAMLVDPNKSEMDRFWDTLKVMKS